MIICSNCRASQLEGTIFCSECGASLLIEHTHETTRSLGQRLPDDAPVTVMPAQAEAPEHGQNGPMITLTIINSGRRLNVNVSEELLIGRHDSARGIVPDIDLSSDGGYEAGVSRRHAILSFVDGVFKIEDMGSANGTFVNGRQLAPSTPAQVRDGDEIACGTLVMRVKIG